MKLAVVGSRSIKDKGVVKQTIAESPWFEPEGHWPPEDWGWTFVSGGAEGVDTSAELIANDYGIDIEIIEPDYSDWSGEEHPALRRNGVIVKESDAVVAVWDGHSNGTEDTIQKALEQGVSTYFRVVE